MSSSKSGAAGPVTRSNGCIVYVLPAAGPRDVDDGPGNRCCSRHRRTDQIGSHAGALTILEVPVAGSDGGFAGLGQVAVRARAHGTAGLVPFETRIAEH